MLRRNQRTVFLVITTLIMLACVPSLSPAAPQLPTYDPNSIYTSIAETAGAAASQTAVFIPPTLTPTVTSLPTRTPTITPTSTPTFIFLLESPTSIGGGSTPGASGTSTGSDKEYACELVSQSPEDNSKIAPGTDFEVRWQVRNIGTKTWASANIDYRYASGAKLHVDSGIYDLYKDIAPGDMADIIVRMRAPGDKDSYTTVWQIRIGKTEFCKLTLTINVK